MCSSQPKRKHPDSDDQWVPPPEATEEDAKRMKAAFDKMADEYVCPITLQFPFHPVIAQDGRIYERDAIEKWWDGGAGGDGGAFPACTAKSPVTNEIISTKLIAASQVRNAIELGIEGGMFIGDRAKAWIARKEAAEADARMVALLKEKAADGNKDSAFALSKAYAEGKYNLAKDEKVSLEWAQKAADLGHAFAATQVGLAYQSGKGPLIKNFTLGMAYVQLGAVLGSECGCYQVGAAYQNGKWGYPQNLELAAVWYRKMPSRETRDAGKHERREKAKAFLDGLETQAS